ncbi:hypothetical protein OMP40_31935 [Cohnella rhizosphaerae]|uniref:Uncharacterized protein n=1 Tax=Cohnella rhizosphaerae TaxID=1457232 RepID=A0A9X4KYW9_9BACL|nr:hypothetical protein [Cohnella rhizosphaerae]MDG0813380.1 hypothetical protein [Cohnella rhizosphaerae]
MHGQLDAVLRGERTDVSDDRHLSRARFDRGLQDELALLDVLQQSFAGASSDIQSVDAFADQKPRQLLHGGGADPAFRVIA